MYFYSVLMFYEVVHIIHYNNYYRTIIHFVPTVYYIHFISRCLILSNYNFNLFDNIIICGIQFILLFNV